MARGSLAVARPKGVVFGFVTLVVLAVVALQGLPQRLLPDLRVPVVSVLVAAPSSTPRQIEAEITKPIERAMATIEGLDTMTSVSGHGRALVELSFRWGTEGALQEVRERLDRVRLPRGVRPVVRAYDPSRRPFMVLMVPKGYSSRLGSEFVPAIARVPGVAYVGQVGVERPGLEVRVRAPVLTMLGMSALDVARAVSSWNLDVPAGRVEGPAGPVRVRARHVLRDEGDLLDLPLGRGASPSISLRDVADVVESRSRPEAMAWLGDEPAVELDVYRESSAPMAALSERLGEVVERWPGVVVLRDEGRWVRESLAGLYRAILLGALAAVGVLTLFLGDPRAMLTMALAVPAALAFAVLGMSALRVSLNLISLGGLGLGVGMLVDSSIVVLEAMDRARCRGIPWPDAVAEGSQEVIPALVASTFTTLAVFLPVWFLEGLAWLVFRDLAITVAASLLGALAVAVWLVPALATLLPMRSVVPRWSAVVEARYARWLTRFLRRPGLVLVLVAMTTLAMVPMVSDTGVEVVPRGGGEVVELGFEIEGASPRDEVDRVRRAVVRLGELPGVSAVATRLGPAPNAGTVSLLLESADAWQRVAEAATRGLELPGVRVWLTPPMDIGIDTEPVVQIMARDRDLAAGVAEELARELEGIPGVIGVARDEAGGEPVISVRLDRSALARLGLRPSAVTDLLRASLGGEVVGRVGEDEVRVRVLGVSTASDLSALDVDPGPRRIPLEAVATLTYRSSSPVLRHVDGRPAQQLRLEVAGPWVVPRLRAAASSPRQDVEVALAGVAEELDRTRGAFPVALGLSVFLVYMVMAMVFESLSVPLVPLAALPTAMAGALAGLALSGGTISLVTLVAAVVLVGVTVNGGIVLVGRWLGAMREGGGGGATVGGPAPEVLAGRERLRAVLMSTVTTMVGLVPMALSGHGWASPMAVVLLWGLTWGTVVTLIVVPAALRLLRARLRVDANGP